MAIWDGEERSALPPEITSNLPLILVTEAYRPALCPTAMQASGMARRYHSLVIFLDLRLPGGDDGRWGLSELRHDQCTESIPVIVTSADTEGLRRHAAEPSQSGAALLAKPFDLGQLLALVQTAIRNPRDQRARRIKPFVRTRIIVGRSQRDVSSGAATRQSTP
jgi:DNA-binding response OmpR family regulator